MKVKDCMLPLSNFPIVNPKTILKEVLVEMGSKRIGLVCIVDNENKFKGIFTDGDVRRLLLKNQRPFSYFFIDDIIDHANLNPVIIKPELELSDAIKLMEEKGIWDLPVVINGELLGLLHLHNAISKLI